jgi:hypothetical protein
VIPGGLILSTCINHDNSPAPDVRLHEYGTKQLLEAIVVVPFIVLMKSFVRIERILSLYV